VSAKTPKLHAEEEAWDDMAGLDGTLLADTVLLNATAPAPSAADAMNCLLFTECGFTSSVSLSCDIASTLRKDNVAELFFAQLQLEQIGAAYHRLPAERIAKQRGRIRTVCVEGSWRGSPGSGSTA
jgi:hypothetical protein